MTLMKKPHTVRIILAAFILFLVHAPFAAWGQAEDEDTLSLLNAWQQEASSASRAPKPLSQTPENITIITAAEIAAINAHTLADLLEIIPGLQVKQLGGPGSTAYTYIQSAGFNHTLIQLDGAPLNKISNFSDTGSVPARIIERVEIVKGSASAAWGPAMGGVINVITKSPDKRTIGGSATASLGSRTTADTNAELSGTTGQFGYYLSAGYLGSNGISEGKPLYSNNSYAKLTYDLPANGQIWATINHTRVNQGENFTYAVPGLEFKENSDQRYLDMTLGLRRQLTEQLGLELTSYYTHRNRYDYSNWLIPPGPWDYIKTRDRVGGGNAKLVWKTEQHLIVGGVEYIHEDFNNTNLLAQTTAKSNSRRIGIYLNDTIRLGQLAVTPGVRLDYVKDAEQFSPSIGATWQLTDKTLIRGYTARGYGYSNIANSTPNSEKIWTTQLGAESTAVPFVWQKLTLYRNQIWNILDSRILIPGAPEQRIALGVEYEARTTPIHNISIGGGYTFTDLTRTSDGSQVKSFARHTAKFLLRYDDQTYRAVLTGNHTFWNHIKEPINFNGSYYGVLWDLHLGATLWKREDSSLELFFSGRNLFNGKQYADELQKNTGRWFEGGVRVRF
jgi:vitamin B12 transporter